MKYLRRNSCFKIRIFARLSYRHFATIMIDPIVTGISLEIMTFGQVRVRGGGGQGARLSYRHFAAIGITWY